MTKSMMNTSRHHSAIAFAAAALILSPQYCFPPAFGAWQIWSVTETKHVLRSESPAPRRDAQIAAARNEWESFQILLRSDTPIKGVRVESGDLVGPSGHTLRAGDARLYREHQLYLDTGTYRNAEFKPDWYPDPLIPFDPPSDAPKRVAPRFKAIPFDLPVAETHGIWVDIHVPADAPPGEYHGVYRVVAESEAAVEVPVSVTVWDFLLPSVPTFATSFGSPAAQLRSYYRQRASVGQDISPQDWALIETQCTELLADHHINAPAPSETLHPVLQSDGAFAIPSPQIEALRTFIDRYHVNALQIPHPSSAVKDPELEQSKLRAWLAAFDWAAQNLHRTNLIFYTYLRDEPNTLEDYHYVQKWGRAIREAKSVVKALVVEQPWTEPGKGGADSAWGDLFGAVDIWCPLFSLHRPEKAAVRLALGEQVWTYTALCQGPPTPWWHIDYPLLNYRVPAWMAWRDHLHGLLYWGGMSYWRQVEDPWTEAPFYVGNGARQQGKKGIVFNGEGSLVYPARAVGYDGIVPTIRLKALRDAIEDYEYLAMLDRLGRAAEADKIVHPLVESFFAWDKNPGAYEQARTKLAALILSATESQPESKRVAVKPREIDDLLANPGMGWQTFHRFADDDKNLQGLPSASAYFRFYWREIEPRDGAIDFAKFDELLAHAHRAGQKLAFRIMCTGSGQYMDVPAWLKDEGCHGIEFQYGGRNHWVPDLADPLFQQKHFRLIRELGQHYDGHPDMDLLDIGSVGLWGEWHMSGTTTLDTGKPVPLPSPQLIDRIIDEWRRAFPRTSQVILIGNGQGMARTMVDRMGWRADCLGDMGGFSKTWNHMDHFYQQQLEKTGAQDAWKTAPVAFESCWDMRKWKQEGWNIGYIFDYALRCHASYVNNKSAPIPEGTRSEIEKFLRRLGYRLVVRNLEHAAAVRAGANLTLDMTWENIGVAPPYRDDRVAFRLTKRGNSSSKPVKSVTNSSIRGWLPGRRHGELSMQIPAGTQPGEYELAVGIVDPETQSPAVRLAISGRDAEGWYPVSRLEVTR